MNVLGLVLLVAPPTFLLGLLVWVVFKHFLTAEVPSTLKHPVKIRFLHCSVLYAIALGNILEKLRICSMNLFVCFAHDVLATKHKDPQVMVTNLRFGTIPVRLFQPKTASCSPRKGIVFYHGGGGMFGSLDSYHNLCTCLARETDSVVLSVGYRKLPDYCYPVMYQDCLNATLYFLKILREYGVDSSRVVACGESLGAGIAAKITQVLIDRRDLPQIRAQVMICPALQIINLQLPSFQQNKNTPFLTLDVFMTCLCKCGAIHPSWQDALMTGSFVSPDFWKKYKKWLSSDNIPSKFKKHYQEPQFPGPFNETAYLETKQLLDVEHIPLLAADEVIAQLPEALLVSCEMDVLRDDTLLYKKRLEDQGVPVTWYHAEDGFHGCILLFDKKPLSFPCSQNVMNAVVSYIKGI
ncbi:arylacetamide deacetylase-like 4 [Ctenodactylus gundi]